ncbi:MAG: NAD(+) synthase [Candidatus Saccharimonas sp.]
MKHSSITPLAYQPSQDHLRVAAATPEVHVAVVSKNIETITSLYLEAASQDVSLITFPELCITGYSIGDLVQHSTLLDQARAGLIELARLTSGVNTAMVVGLPFAVGNAIYNTAALLADGEIKGIVPKQHLPTYKEFYEKRWYQSWDNRPNIVLTIDGYTTSFGLKQLFMIAGTKVGIEVCEDLWVPESPHIFLVKEGADIIVNPSASPEIASKAGYRSNLVNMTAAKQLVGYVYAGADHNESTMDIVMSGHALISEGGRQLAERKPFDMTAPRLTIADIDYAHLRFDRRQTTNFPNEFSITPTETTIKAVQKNLLRDVDPYPFIPKGDTEQVAERLDEILTIQTMGLYERLRGLGEGAKMVVGLSGGLDSTLAFLVMVRVAKVLGKEPRECIDTLTMPARASSARTQSNALRLAAAFGIDGIEIPIANIAKQQLNALGHDGKENVTFENTHARIRTALLFNHANAHHGLVVGTGDLSEIALGWSTYNGDHMSHYNPNASIPKTLIRSLVKHAADELGDDARDIIADIVDTPVSPELTGNGTLSQETEAILGSYDLHDFFEYHFVRWMEPSDKIEYLARNAHLIRFSETEITRVLSTYMQRFFTNQWKRSVMPDGPKVGTVSHSPRGDWRMPSDLRGAQFAFYAKLGLMQQ